MENALRSFDGLRKTLSSFDRSARGLGRYQRTPSAGRARGVGSGVPAARPTRGAQPAADPGLTHQQAVELAQAKLQAQQEDQGRQLFDKMTGRGGNNALPDYSDAKTAADVKAQHAQAQEADSRDQYLQAYLPYAQGRGAGQVGVQRAKELAQPGEPGYEEPETDEEKRADAKADFAEAQRKVWRAAHNVDEDGNPLEGGYRSGFGRGAGPAGGPTGTGSTQTGGGSAGGPGAPAAGPDQMDARTFNAAHKNFLNTYNGVPYGSLLDAKNWSPVPGHPELVQAVDKLVPVKVTDPGGLNSHTEMQPRYHVLPASQLTNAVRDANFLNDQSGVSKMFAPPPATAPASAPAGPDPTARRLGETSWDYAARQARQAQVGGANEDPLPRKLGEPSEDYEARQNAEQAKRVAAYQAAQNPDRNAETMHGTNGAYPAAFMQAQTAEEQADLTNAQNSARTEAVPGSSMSAYYAKWHPELLNRAGTPDDPSFSAGLYRTDSPLVPKVQPGLVSGEDVSAAALARRKANNGSADDPYYSDPGSAAAGTAAQPDFPSDLDKFS